MNKTIYLILILVSLATGSWGQGTSCWEFLPASNTLILIGDDVGANVTLPFSFPFAGSSYADIEVSTNGSISFGAPYIPFTPNNIPNIPMMMPFWADGGVTEVYLFQDPNRVIITWLNVPISSNSSSTNSFQVILESNGCFSYSYDDMQWTNGGTLCSSNPNCSYNGQNYTCLNSGGFCGAPAIVGINYSGSNFVQIGEFDHPGTDYDGPFNSPDGVDWLDNQCLKYSNGPQNDMCDNAEVISGYGTFPFSMVGATADGITNCCYVETVEDVWFKWTAPATGTSQIQCLSPTGISVFQGANCNDMCLKACALNAQVGSVALDFETEAGEEYIIGVASTTNPTSLIISSTTNSPTTSPCHSDFNVTTLGCEGQPTTFEHVGQPGFSYIDFWDFGDGNTFQGNPPATTGLHQATHTYQNAGTYTVSLIGEGIGPWGGPLRVCLDEQDVIIPTCCPTTGASFTNTGNCADIGVDFDLTVNYAYDNVSWDFGDGGMSTLEDPTHTYAVLGTPGSSNPYNVVATVNGPGACSQNVQNTLSIYDPNTAQISLINQMGGTNYCSEENLIYGLTPIGVYDNVMWDFGDGGTSNTNVGQYSYPSSGNFSVQTTFSNSNSTCPPGVASQSIEVECCKIAAEIDVDGECVEDPVNFSLVNLQGDFSSATYSWNFGNNRNGSTMNPTHQYTYPYMGEVSVAITVDGAPGVSGSTCTINTNTSVAIMLCAPCDTCITSFSPLQGRKYVLSAWVKENAPPTTKTYTGPSISLNYPSIGITQGPFFAKGNIIDGWQRIEQEFTVPATAVAIKVQLNNEGSNQVFFDDIRVHPFDANMKSFVYDPVTLRLSAELDENNYATYYEYDEEGKLIRVKKETQNGIKTIQESRENTVK